MEMKERSKSKVVKMQNVRTAKVDRTNIPAWVPDSDIALYLRSIGKTPSFAGKKAVAPKVDNMKGKGNKNAGWQASTLKATTQPLSKLARNSKHLSSSVHKDTNDNSNLKSKVKNGGKKQKYSE